MSPQGLVYGVCVCVCTYILLCVWQCSLASKWLIFVTVWGSRELNYWRLVFHQAEIKATHAEGSTHMHIVKHNRTVNHFGKLLLLKTSLEHKVQNETRDYFRVRVCAFTALCHISHFTSSTSTLGCRAVISSHLLQFVGCWRKRCTCLKHTF